ncbi:hypothetical protein N3K66_005367 [Trichothecium roseum]|uniref:Uncharacterized protein n=1 Tax=Trichothecium roseum TaxID=47278 RepID=A0ACC0UXW1_9HYPO|nr:hypothetical protein N3K66_005367 [Trichothecium roseum]
MDGNDTGSTPAASPSSIIRSRISNACDGCKARKVKCDGRQPCSYCIRRQRPRSCHYTPQRRRQQQQQQQQQNKHRASTGYGVGVSPGVAVAPQSPPSTARAGPSSKQTSPDGPAEPEDSINDGGGGSVAEDETEVQRDARLLCDAQGKLIFIGDCAPLSFFQSVRQLVTSRVGQNAFAPETSRYSVLENAAAASEETFAQGQGPAARDGSPPEVDAARIHTAIDAYLVSTSALIDVFDRSRLFEELPIWATLPRKPQNLASAINYLVLAIGKQRDDAQLAQAYFEHARDQAYRSLNRSLSEGTVQAFLLVTVYMLCSCQINSAFLVFGIAARAAYSIGMHRTEVNARFGDEGRRQRDGLWKSLRAVDLFLSTSMGRPPATSDVDCTVSYYGGGGGEELDGSGEEALNLNHALVQILLIVETVVTEVYSRRKISLQLTEGISVQLREWSAAWLSRLRDALDPDAGRGGDEARMSGACQVLSTYYYAVMLVSRPFLMYEVFRRLSDAPGGSGGSGGGGSGGGGTRSPLSTTGKTRLADACIDAACLMVDRPLLELMRRGELDGRMPVLVSWLFAASLVLGLGLLGGFGRILERHCRDAIEALDHLARTDTHARQYSLIAQSLLTTALEHLEKRERQERRQRTESSSQLFGLMPTGGDGRGGSGLGRSPSRNGSGVGSSFGTVGASPAHSYARGRGPGDRGSPFGHHHHHSHNHSHSYNHPPQRLGTAAGATSSPRLPDFSSAAFGLGGSVLSTTTPEDNFWTGQDGDALNLFPLLDAGGGIDLAHYYS